MSSEQPSPQHSTTSPEKPVSWTETLGQSEVPELPVASLRETSETLPGMIRTSRLWWVTALCVLIAGGLTWMSLPEQGPEITIQFPDGHGLQIGDALRYRGIDAGIVTGVSLAPTADRIEVTVRLSPPAVGLAREGSRFWIVRPQITSTGITGLETAIGPRYIAVVPGPSSAPSQRGFEGLAATPPDHDGGLGTDIVLRADAQYGVAPGAPIAWRGVQVGKILSVDLSPDARFVDLHARIDSRFRRLLRNTSRFWVTSGMEMNVGLNGVRITADSLSTIIRGGVTFTTPALGAVNTPVPSGTIFRLYREAEPGWTAALTTAALVDFPIPPTLTIPTERRTTFLGFPRSETELIHGVLIPDANRTRLITTASALASLVQPATSGANANEIRRLAIRGPAAESSVEVPVSAGQVVIPKGGSIASLLLDSPPPELPVAELTIRTPEGPEDSILCRSVSEDGKALSVIHPIAQSEMTVVIEGEEVRWLVNQPEHDLTAWQGAPVTGASDGRLIGILIVTDQGSMIVPLTKTSF